MSLTLLVACGLLLRTIYTLRHVPLGYRTDHIIVRESFYPVVSLRQQNVTATLYEPLLERTQQLHGVQAAGLISEVPLGQTFNILLTLRMNGNDNWSFAQTRLSRRSSGSLGSGCWQDGISTSRIQQPRNP